MGFRSVALALGLAVAGGAPQASALTLQDLANGGSLAALGGTVVFQNFQVKAKKADLAQVQVVAAGSGWSLDLTGLDREKIDFRYEVVVHGTTAEGARLELDGTGTSRAESEIKAANGNGKLKKVAKLKVGAGGSASQSFDPTAMLYVKGKVEVKQPEVDELLAGFVLTSPGLLQAAAVLPGPVTNVPEPGTALLLLSAAAGLALLRRAA